MDGNFFQTAIQCTNNTGRLLLTQGLHYHELFGGFERQWFWLGISGRCSKELATLDGFEEDIPGILIPTTVLTFPQRHIAPLSDCLCEQVLDEQLPAMFDEFERKEGKGVELFAEEPRIPAELRDVPMIEAKGFAGGHEEQPESVWVNGRELSKASKVKDLQEACNYLGINASGAKSKLYDRLCSYLSKQFQKDVDRSKNNLQKLERGPQPLLQAKGVEKPTNPKLIEQHEATHLPFAAWCDICVKTKSKEDKTLQNSDESVESSGVPHIQMDWMYLGRSCPALIMVDTMTRYGAIFPARSKGAWKALAEFCVKFSLGLNHVSEVVYVMDPEPATLGLLDMVVMIRQEMGYPTSKKIGKPYHKGRTARVERYIQTVRRQASALMASVEGNIHELLDDLHCLRAWSLVHSVFLLNRYHEHSAIRATSYETVFGRSRAWRPDVVLALTSSPWTKEKGSGPVGILEAPLPTIEEKHEGPEPRQPILLQSGEVDEDAEEVFGLGSYEPTEPGSLHAEEGQTAMEAEPLERLTDMQRKSLLGIRTIPATPTRPLEVDQEGQPAEKREAEELEEERGSKVARFDRETSPQSSPKALYSPLYAGGVNQVNMSHGDACWEEDVDWELIEDEIGEFEPDFYGERPPNLSPEELDELDAEAMKVEIEKLTAMGVVQTLEEQEMDPEGKFIDLKEVYDWRYRDGKWKRRCRVVAREFRTGPSTDETFSPTSSYAVVRLFLFCPLFFGWKVAALDISDAYLTVVQKETCYVKISQWMKELLKLPENSLWQLKRVLPGQRNGAQRWFQDFSHHLQELGFDSCTAMPSVLRHRTKKLAINIHVDDELVVGETVEDIEWVIGALKKIYKLQVEGPMPKESLGNGEELNYLKKTYVFQEDGVYVRPNSKFTETLVKLYGLQDRKDKQVPEHSLLGSPDTSAELDKKRQADFRTGLGTAMYMSCWTFNIA